MSYLNWRRVYPAFTSPPGHKGRAEHKVFFFLILHIPHACRPLLWLSTVLALRHPRSPPTGTQPTLPATLTPPTPTQSLSPLCLVLVPFMCIFLTVHHRYFSSSIWRDMLFYICRSVDTVLELINRICLMNYCSFLDLRSI